MFLERDRDTIAAISTAPGRGGIAVLRVSGARAQEIVRQLAAFLPERLESHRVYFGTILDRGSGSPVDEVLITYFGVGRSFTGEETLEISCHGGDYLAQFILDELLAGGARLADRGEFTYRAFINGRIDLTQAEGVLSLIESQSQRAARLAARQLKGDLSLRMREIEEELVWVQANLEANIDFAQEDIVVADPGVLRARLDQALLATERLLQSYQGGRLLREGLQVALVGRPNVGKSSLLNAFLEEERAIVTDIPGTTRDPVEGRILVDGVTVHLTDTAGLRSSDDVVERIGIDRARAVLADADLVFFVFEDELEEDALSELASLGLGDLGRLVFLRNKVDLGRAGAAMELRERLGHGLGRSGHGDLQDSLRRLGPERFHYVSAKNGTGIEGVLGFLSSWIKGQAADVSAVAINARHQELLRVVGEAISRAQDLLAQDASGEFVAFELQEAILATHQVLGKRFDDQVMDRVFKDFCIGK